MSRPHRPANTSTPAPSYDLGACRKHALFFSSIPLHNILAIILIIAVGTISIYLTHRIQIITPGATKEDDTPETQPAPVHVSSTSSDAETPAIPDTNSPSLDEDQPPPPYVHQPPTPSTTTPTVIVAIAPPSKPKPKRSSAHLFVLGTMLLLANATLLFFDALSVQSRIFCTGSGLSKQWRHDPAQIATLSLLWLSVAIPTYWATKALLCWLILLRDLWGPSMKKKYPIRPEFLVITVVVLLVSPFTIVFGGGYLIKEGFKRYGPLAIEGMAKAVEFCQRKCCAGALEEDGEELGDVVLEEERRVNDEHADAGEGSAADHEERVGLIAGMDK